MRIAFILALGLVIALGSPAHAGDVGVVVAGESYMQPELAAQIESWLSQHGHTLVQSPLPPEAVTALNDCFVAGDQRCARGVVEKRARSSSVIYARLDSRSDASGPPDVTLTAYWFNKGHDAITERKTCQHCTDQSLRTTADEIMKKLVGGADPGHIKLKSAPPGATITIDGQAIGVTPLDWDLTPGKHTIQMDKPGRRAESKDIVIASNKSDLLVMTLAADGDDRDQPSRIVPLAMVIGGGVAVVAGAGLIVFSPGPTPTERYYRDTQPAGIGVAIGGAVVGGLGAYLLWFRSPAATSTPVAAFTGDTGYVGWLGRF